MTPSGSINNYSDRLSQAQKSWHSSLLRSYFFSQLVSSSGDLGPNRHYLSSGTPDFLFLTETSVQEAISGLLNDTWQLSSKVIEKSLEEGWLPAGLHWLLQQQPAHQRAAYVVTMSEHLENHSGFGRTLLLSKQRSPFFFWWEGYTFYMKESREREV